MDFFPLGGFDHKELRLDLRVEAKRTWLPSMAQFGYRLEGTELILP